MNWNSPKIRQLISLEYGKSLPKENRNLEGEYPVAGSNGPDGHHSKKLVNGPGIVIGRKGSAGKIVWYDNDFWPIDTTFYVKPKLELNLRWLYYFLLKLELEKLAITTGVPGINRNSVYNLKIPFPPSSEQKRIVEILNQADALSKKRAEADKIAERIIPALFYKMFEDPATNPMDWDTVKFEDVGTLDRGRSKHRPRNATALLGGPYPLIQTGDIANSGGRITSYTQTYSEIGLKQSKMWPAGTLCITIAANIAKTGILEFDSCFPDSIVGFLPSDSVTIEYVQTWLSFLQPVLEANAPQAAQKNINLEILRNLPFRKPPKPIQEKFSHHVSEFFNQQKNQLINKKKIEKLFEVLMYRAFSGELTAKWREAHMEELLREMEIQASSLNEVKT